MALISTGNLAGVGTYGKATLDVSARGTAPSVERKGSQVITCAGYRTI